MLKLTYIENGFHLEYLAQSLEEWVALRVMLALRVGECIYVEPSTASFVLPTDLPGLNFLKAEAQQQAAAIAVCVCDPESLEVSFQGTWLTSDAESVEGVFVAALSHSTEVLILNLWQAAQIGASVLSD